MKYYLFTDSEMEGGYSLVCYTCRAACLDLVDNWASNRHNEFVGILDRPYGDVLDMVDEFEKEKAQKIESARWHFIKKTPKYNIYHYDDPREDKGYKVIRKKRDRIVEFYEKLFIPEILSDHLIYSEFGRVKEDKKTTFKKSIDLGEDHD